MVDNIIFGKEIKGLNLLNNPDWKYTIYEGDLPHGDNSPFINNLREHIKIRLLLHKDLLKSSIRYITRPVWNLWEKNETKLCEIMGNREDRIQYGVHVYKNDDRFQTHYFYCNVETNDVFYLFFLAEDLIYANITVSNGLGGLEVRTFNPLKYSSQWLKAAEGRFRSLEPFDFLDTQLELDYLINHMSIDPVFLGPRAKLHEQECRYENHTNHSIEIIKSNYLYDLHKSGAFKVSGHFRWQPVKINGVDDKKLIFISDFVKTGYTTKKLI